MESKFDCYGYDQTAKPNLLFRRTQPNGLYRCISIGRHSNPYGLYPFFALTYNKHWEGEPASPLGRDGGRANLIRDSRAVPAEEQWITFDPNQESLNEALNILFEEFKKFVEPFFEKAEKELLNSKLLQTALKEADSISMKELEGLEERLQHFGGVVSRLDHPAYLKVKQSLRNEWTEEVSKEERSWTSRLAYDSLALKKGSG